MRREFGMSVTPALAMQPSAALVAFAELLAMPSLALEERVQRELDQNPALERDVEARCPTCGEAADGGCPFCRVPARWEAAAWPDPPEHGPAADVLGRVAHQESPAEGLGRELRLLLPQGDRAIADWLVGNLDGRGRLEVGIDEAAAALSVAPDRVARVLRVLQRVGPPGVGAADARECLLLQLDRWEEEHTPEPLVREVLERHLEAMGAGRLRAIAEATGASEANIAAARDFIRSHFRPYPSLDGAPHDRLADLRSVPLLLPDLVIRKLADVPEEYVVHVVESRRLALAISRPYRELAAAGSGDGGWWGRAGAVSSGDRGHAQVQVRRARFFLARLHERWHTMQAIAEWVVVRQQAFLRDGPAALQPLSRAEVAAALGLHESTVSRAVAGKYALLPSYRLMPVAGFFGASPGAREALRQMIAAEDHPMPDAELARALAGRGYRVARRTVAKYRTCLGIPVHSLR